MIGQTISHYKILEKLGEGGMGVVYKAHDTELDRVVALKFLPHYLTSDPAEKERFYHEARAASALNHPNITTIYEIRQSEDQLYLAMEFIEGKTIKSVIEHETVSVRKALDIAIQVCEGLSAAHEKGVVHRDIKSDNVMLTAKGQVKIMDFGLAKVKGSTKLTKAGSTLGTAAYMSPEQAQGEDVDHRSDLFSFGVVLYELLTSKLPFRGEHQAALMYSLINEDPQPVLRFNEKVSPELERIVMKALAKEKEDRYQHADDMLADLRRERKGLEYAKSGYVRTVTAAQPTVASPKRKSSMVIVGAAVILIIVIAAVIFNPFNFQITTQKSAAAAPEKNTLAILYFQNIPDPADKNHTGDMLTDLLITSLSQSKDVEVLSRERLYDIQKELQADAKSISPDMASKVAQRAGVTMMLLGSILQEAPLMVTTRLVDVKSGKIINSQRISGFSQNQIFALVDTLGLLVHRDITGSFSTTTEEQQSVAQVTTSSPEAYRSYVEGMELNEKFYYAEAEAAFRKAIELDTNFAMAYFWLANANGGDVDYNETINALRRAYALSGKLTEREHLMIQSAYVDAIEKNWAKSTSLMEEYIGKYPHDQSAYVRLTSLYNSQHEFEKTLQICNRGLQVDSLDKLLWNQKAYTLAGFDRREEAFSAIDTYARLAPAEPNPYDSKGDICMMLGEPDSAMMWWKKALTFKSDFQSSQKIATQYLKRGNYNEFEKYFTQYVGSLGEKFRDLASGIPVMVAMRQGKLNQAYGRMLDLMISDEKTKSLDWISFDYANLAIIADALGQSDTLVKYGEMYAQTLSKDSLVVDDAKFMLAVVYRTAGKKELSAKIIGELQKKFQSMTPYEQRQFAYAQGLIAYEDGDYTTALAKFQQAIQDTYPNHAGQFDIAMCLLKLNRLDEAIAEFQKCTWYTNIYNIHSDGDEFPFAQGSGIHTAPTHYMLGIAYERQGKNTDAIREYKYFLDSWKDADFKSSELADAKERLLKLTGKVTG